MSGGFVTMLMSFETVSSRITGPGTPVALLRCRCATVAAECILSKAPLTVSFVPASTADTAPCPVITFKDCVSTATGESRALKMAYRIMNNGAQDARPFFVYGYGFNLNNAKTVKSLTLPDNSNVKLLAITLAH